MQFSVIPDDWGWKIELSVIADFCYRRVVLHQHSILESEAIVAPGVPIQLFFLRLFHDFHDPSTPERRTTFRASVVVEWARTL